MSKLFAQFQKFSEAMTDLIPFALKCYDCMRAGTIEIDALKLTPAYKAKLEKAVELIREELDSQRTELPDEFVAMLPAVPCDPADMRDLPLMEE